MILRPRGDIEIETYEVPEPHPAVTLTRYGWQVYFDEHSLIDSGIHATSLARWIRVRWEYLKYRFGRGKA